VAQRALQALVFGHGAGLDQFAADAQQPAAAATRGRGGAAALAQGRQPAARRVVGGDADAGGVHQRAHLQLRQVAFLLGTAVLHHRHVAALAAAGGKARQPRTQAAQAPAGQPHRGLALDRRRPRHQLGPRRAIVPGQQGLQILVGVGQQHRHTLDQHLEGRVGAHDQPRVVEDQHAHRAEVEPLRQLVERALGLCPRHVLGGGVLHQLEQQTPAAGLHRVQRGAAPAPGAVGMQQPALEQGGHAARARAVAEGAACGHEQVLLVGRRQLGHVVAQQRDARPAAEGDEGVVGVDDAVRLVVQQGRKRRCPQHAQQFGLRAVGHGPGASLGDARGQRRGQHLQAQHAQRAAAPLHGAQRAGLAGLEQRLGACAALARKPAHQLAAQRRQRGVGGLAGHQRQQQPGSGIGTGQQRPRGRGPCVEPQQRVGQFVQQLGRDEIGGGQPGRAHARPVTRAAPPRPGPPAARG